MIFLLLLYVICVCIVFFVCFFFVIQIVALFTTQAPFVPTPKNAEQQVTKALELHHDSVLYDLGCGDGRMLVNAVTAHPSIRAIGVEIAIFPYLLARWNTRSYPNIEIIRKDIFNVDIRHATHIFCYLYPHILERLVPHIEKNHTEKVRMVSCDFSVKNREPDQIIDLHNTSSSRGKKLFVYTIAP